jgi:predicted MFS family arabinose efflux permease
MVVRSRAYAFYVLALLTGTNFINYVDRLVIVTMYDGLRLRFNFTDQQLGAFWLAFFTVHALATFPLGWASDHFDRRKIMGFGVLAWSFATLGSAYAWGFGSMLLLRGLIGIGEAAYGPPANALLCEVFPDKKARVVGIFNAGMFAGACVGLAVGGLIGFPDAFKIVAIPGIFLGLLILFLDIPPERVQAEARPRMSAMLRDGWRALRVPTLRWMLPSGILISFAAGGYITWIVDFTLRYKGLTQKEATLIYGFITLTAGIAGVVASGFIADRLMRRTQAGRAVTVAIGFFCSVPFALLVVAIDRGLAFYACGFALLFFIPWYNGPMAAVIDDVVDDEDAGTAQATFVFFLHVLGTGPAGFILGTMSAYSNLRVAFLLPAGAILGAAVCALMATRHVGRDMAEKQRRRVLRASAGLAA